MVKTSDVERNPLGSTANAPLHPLFLFLLLGRGARGKSFFARLLLEHMRSLGHDVVAVDGDRQNATTARFFVDARRPESAEESSYRLWFKTSMGIPILERKSVLFDLGASGDHTIKEICYKADVTKYCVERSVTPVAIHSVGADLDDLSTIDAFERAIGEVGSRPVFAPPITILALNAGVTRTPGNVQEAFRPILEHDILKKALARGAKPLMIPYLEQASAINAATASFKVAIGNEGPKGKPLFDPFTQSEIESWHASVIEQLNKILSW
jgi:NAD(P)-dependent dehydrogenase (short-subunit alcohol dehydrogenase family)